MTIGPWRLETTDEERRYSLRRTANLFHGIELILVDILEHTMRRIYDEFNL